MRLIMFILLWGSIKLMFYVKKIIRFTFFNFSKLDVLTANLYQTINVYNVTLLAKLVFPLIPNVLLAQVGNSYHQVLVLQPALLLILEILLQIHAILATHPA
jgi:hypothetical protein